MGCMAIVGATQEKAGTVRVTAALLSSLGLSLDLGPLTFWVSLVLLLYVPKG